MPKTTTPEQPIAVENLMPHDPGWACCEAAGRIAAVLAMLDEVENDHDPEGWTLRTAVQVLEGIQDTLLASIAQGKAERGKAGTE